MALKTINDEHLVAIGEAIREKNGTTTQYKPSEMGAAIRTLSTGGLEEEPVVLYGNQSYGCTRDVGAAYIKLYGNRITTLDLSNCSYLFYMNTSEYIPFDINLSTYKADCSYMFSNCSELKEIPKIIGSPTDISYMFNGCSELKEIPENLIETMKFDKLREQTSYKMGGVFGNCYSLEKIPTNLLKELYGIQTSSSSTPYYRTFYQCYNLKRVDSLAVQPSILTSNAFSSTFDYCCKLREFTFDTNEDGTPKTAQWKNQTIDLTKAGYGSESYIIAYSDSTAEDRIKDETEFYEVNLATSENLDAMPNVYATKAKYSLYNNQRGALDRTLYSLPDCSEYLSGTSYTNTIKFANHSVEENAAAYAAATAKGWTITSTTIS